MDQLLQEGYCGCDSISDNLSTVRANCIQILALLPSSGLQLFQWMLVFIIVLDYRV